MGGLECAHEASILECGGSSHRLPRAVHTENMQGMEEDRWQQLPPFAHSEAIVLLRSDLDKAVPAAALILASSPYWARVKGGSCCYRTPPSVHTGNVQGTEEERWQQPPPSAHSEAIVLLRSDLDKAVPAVALIASSPYWAPVKGGSRCYRTPRRNHVRGFNGN
jgi:hypothetical protein